MSFLKGWRTVIVNTLFAVLPVLQLSEVADVLPESWVPWYSLFIVLANLYLRKVTTTPMGKKQ